MKVQFSSATVEMPVRDQPMLSAMGLRNTPSENIVPIPTQVMAAPHATTIQP